MSYKKIETDINGNRFYIEGLEHELSGRNDNFLQRIISVKAEGALMVKVVCRSKKDSQDEKTLLLQVNNAPYVEVLCEENGVRYSVDKLNNQINLFETNLLSKNRNLEDNGEWKKFLNELCNSGVLHSDKDIGSDYAKLIDKAAMFVCGTEPFEDIKTLNSGPERFIGTGESQMKLQ